MNKRNKERAKNITQNKTITFLSIGEHDVDEQQAILEMLRNDFYGEILINEINNATNEIVVYNNPAEKRTDVNSPYKFKLSKLSQEYQNILMQGMVKHLRMTILYTKKDWHTNFKKNFSMYPLEPWSISTKDILFQGNTEMKPNLYYTEFPEYWHTYPKFMTPLEKLETLSTYYRKNLFGKHKRYVKVQMFRLANLLEVNVSTLLNLKDAYEKAKSDKKILPEKNKLHDATIDVIDAGSFFIDTCDEFDVDDNEVIMKL